MAGFPWADGVADPAQILGDARPRDVKSLLKKGGVWVALYRGWLEANSPDDVRALDFLVQGGTADKAYTKSWIDHLDGSFDAFVTAVGSLKAQLHHETDAVYTSSQLEEAFPFWGEGTGENGGDDG